MLTDGRTIKTVFAVPQGQAKGSILFASLRDPLVSIAGRLRHCTISTNLIDSPCRSQM